MMKSIAPRGNVGQPFDTRKWPDEVMKILEVNSARPRARLALAHDTHCGERTAAIMAFLCNKRLKRAA
jgi:hypothetical protein